MLNPPELHRAEPADSGRKPGRNADADAEQKRDTHMDDVGETQYPIYTHERPQLTVGDLRTVIEGLPDHLPLRVYAPITPGQQVELELIVVDTGHAWERDDTGDERIDPALGLVCDFPSGEHALEP